MSTGNEWWQEFFSGAGADFTLGTREEQTNAEADFIEKALQLEPGASVVLLVSN